MIVCQCKAVGHRRIDEAIDRGAHDVDAIGRACGAGTDCGGCHPRLADALERHGVPVLLPSGP